MGETTKRWRVFIHNVRGDWWVHERTSGGLLCDAGTRDRARRSATELIWHTPDFAQQLLALGPASVRPEMPTKDGMERQWRALHQPT